MPSRSSNTSPRKRPHWSLDSRRICSNATQKSKKWEGNASWSEEFGTTAGYLSLSKEIDHPSNGATQGHGCVPGQGVWAGHMSQNDNAADLDADTATRHSYLFTTITTSPSPWRNLRYAKKKVWPSRRRPMRWVVNWSTGGFIRPFQEGLTLSSTKKSGRRLATLLIACLISTAYQVFGSSR